MARTNATAEAIAKMVRFFLPHCAEQSTLLELRDMTADSKLWRGAHKLFGRIRDKTLLADRTKNARLQYQYSFEEICAKTLYNMADHSAGFSSEYLPPFDEDSSFWVMGIARAFARFLGATDFECISSDLDETFRFVAE